MPREEHFPPAEDVQTVACRFCMHSAGQECRSTATGLPLAYPGYHLSRYGYWAKVGLSTAGFPDSESEAWDG